MTGAGRAERERQLSLALGQVLETTLGRRFVYALLEDAGIFRESFSESPLLMAHAEGKRARGLSLLLDLQTHHPAACDLLLHEGLAWKRELEAIAETAAE